MVDDAVKNTTVQNAPAVLPTAGTNTDKKPAAPAETALDAAKAAQWAQLVQNFQLISLIQYGTDRY